MDKAKLEINMQSIVARVRDEYWLSKLGGCKGRREKVCQCSECGGMRLKKDTEKYVVAKEKDLVKLSPTPDTTVKKTKKVKKKVKRQRASSSQTI